MKRVSSLVLIFLLSFFPLAAQTKQSSTKKKASGHISSKKQSPLNRAKAAQTRQAFVASTTLRPMAQQLLRGRNPAAYAGVERYAWAHEKSSAGALAWLVIGYARQQDKDYPAAIVALKKARAYAGEVSDYVSWILAMALRESGNQAEAARELFAFATKFPGSILQRDATVLRAGALLESGDAATALRELQPLGNWPHAEVQFLTARAYEGTGNLVEAAKAYQNAYYDFPLSWDATAARTALASLATKTNLPAVSFARRLARAQGLFTGKRFQEAADDFKELIRQRSGEAADSAAIRSLNVSYAAVLFKLKQIDAAKKILESLAGLPDEINAERLYYLHEIARSQDNGKDERQLIDSLRETAPQSEWRQEALLSAANMHLLRQDYADANKYFSELAQSFPRGKYGGYSHWRAAWLTFHFGEKSSAKTWFEEQINLYASGAEIPAAIYWRGRLAEEENDAATAAAYYRKLFDRFRYFYYADLARDRLKNFHASATADPPLLEKIPPLGKSPLFGRPPEDDLRYQKSKLLANGALYDFAARELQATVGDDSNWRPLALARLFHDGGQHRRALETMKHAIPSYFSLEVRSLPREQWEMLFPLPYWDEIKRSSAANGVDPYLMAALIRQESEFDAEAVSRANAYGLMQILPSVGKQLAKHAKIRGFAVAQLLDPTLNIRLGTRYCRELLDKYAGQDEYVLAAYNAGSDRVDAWRNDAKYRDAAEFVESIPFSETREYVEAIMRNASLYRLLYAAR